MTTNVITLASGIIEIRDPGIEATAFLRRIEANLASRQELPAQNGPGRANDLPEYRALSEELGALKRQIERYGRVETHRKGWVGRLDLLWKHFARKAIKWDIVQQQEVHSSLARTLDRLASYLTRQDSLGSQRIIGIERSLGRDPHQTDKATGSDRVVEPARLVSSDPLAASYTDGSAGSDGARARIPSLYDAPSGDRQDASFDYHGFEQRFRGSFDEIKRRMTGYLPHVRDAAGVVLDIGCGRGEFVELLVEAGIPVRGVDVNPKAVEFARQRGLPVSYGEGLSELSLASDDSLGGVFLGQVIEHLEPQVLLRLIHLAYRKLAPGGVFIAETPNPQCLLVFAESFYLDPSHTKPVHPLTLEFALQSSGFRDVKLTYSSSAADLCLPRLQAGGIANLDDYNLAVERMNNILFGYRDYAGIGIK